MEWQVPTLAHVLEARRHISPHLRPTPLFGYPSLDELLDADVVVKHENHQPVGAFKVRGGVNLLSQLSAEERERGVIAASTGNHGQSVAYAANTFGVPAIICVPENAKKPGEAAIREATRLMMEHTRNLVEPAGAAPLAAALKLRDRLRGKRIALVASGGNISPLQLAALYR